MSIFILYGCYLANGSPSEAEFWIKKNNTKENELREMKYCSSKSIESLNESQRFYFENGEKNFFLWYENNKEKYKLYSDASKLYSKYLYECLYQLGYRFRAPIQWCLAQDGDNTKICIDNMKYRN